MDQQVKIHLNDEIKVRLTEAGKMILYRREKAIQDRYPGIKFKQSIPKADEEGYTHFLLWEFMDAFGEHLHMGVVYNVIHPLEIVLAKRNVEENENGSDGVCKG